VNDSSTPAAPPLDVLQADIKKRIEVRFPGADVQLSGDSGRMQISVTSNEFADMTRLQKQQSVYACINELITGGSLHAVSITTLTADD
jgi:acid stress-induced BolA-like protein IbaG/YrbA